MVILGIFILSLGIKIAILALAGEPIIFNKYPYFAERLLHGDNIGERLLDLSPFYLYAAALFLKIFGPNWDLLMFFQILLGALNNLLLYAIASRLFGTATGVIASILLVFYGNITLIELTLEPETLLIFFNSLTVWTLLKAADDSSCSITRVRWWLMAGIMIGLSAITKAVSFLILPGAVVWIGLTVSAWRNRWKAGALLLLGTILVVSPVTIRNYLQFNDFVLTTADGGKVFFHGNGPGATGMERADLPDQGFIEEGHKDPDYAHALFRETARRQGGANLRPSECSGYWFARTTKYMQENPWESVGLALKKFCLFWNNYEVHDLDTTYRDYLLIKSWPFLTFGTLAALGLLGMGMSLGRFRQAFLGYWMVLIQFFSVVVFFAASRYRLPAAPFLSMFAACFLMDVFCRIRQEQTVKYVGALALFLVLLVGTYMPYNQEIEKFDRWQQAARIHYSLGGRLMFKRGEYRKALKELGKVVAVDPGFAPAYNYMGKSHAVLGNFDLAQNCFTKVISLSPGIDEGYLNIGLLLELKGEWPRALPYFEKALSLNPNNPKAKNHLAKWKEKRTKLLFEEGNVK